MFLVHLYTLITYKMCNKVSRIQILRQLLYNEPQGLLLPERSTRFQQLRGLTGKAHQFVRNPFKTYRLSRKQIKQSMILSRRNKLTTRIFAVAVILTEKETIFLKDSLQKKVSTAVISLKTSAEF